MSRTVVVPSAASRWPHFQSLSEGASKCLCRAESGGGGGDDGAPEIRCLW
jgi:hypothetical protein